ncbi:MAG: glycine zipper domain-containing protein [Rubrimonas sp.]|uniref:glycine zipper domain-containing protein n=1 Tax=Rubrimonas sp. TaxID=2036015 RepID=UPI002FDCE699
MDAVLKPTTFPCAVSRALRGGLAALLAVSMTLQGCATVPVNDVADTCAPNRAPLAAIVEQYNERFKVNVAGGAAAGAAAGAAIGAARGNLLAGLLIGAATGALAGAAVSYYNNQQQKYQNQADLRRAIDGDIRAAKNDVGSVASAVTRLNQCRLNQLADLRKRVQGGARGEAEAAQLATIRRWMDDDRKLIETVVGDFADGNSIYTDAYAQSRQIDKDRVAPRVARYQPKVVQPRTAKGAPPKLPTVASAPRASNDAEALVLATANLQASQQAQARVLDAELDSIGLLLK